MCDFIVINNLMSISELQRAKKVVSDNPGLVDFAVRLVNSVLNLPIREVRIFFMVEL